MRQRYRNLRKSITLQQGLHFLVPAGVSSCASPFTLVFPPRGNFPQKGNDQRNSYWREKGRVHSVLVLRREVQQRQHPGIEESA